ncbi:MAG: InlB B-repeat-containing protein, partial [Candidatus Ornithomonoglobus sp.]
MNKKKYSGWIALFAAMVFVVQAIQIPVFAATTVNTAEELSAAVNTTGEYELGASFSVNQLDIRADQIKINGNGHTLTSANTNMGQASMCNKLDGLHTTFENITLDGGNQAKTDTCLWIGRGSWIWNGVTVQNWNSTSSNNRGAVTAGKSQNDPGKLTIYNSIIKNNHQGIAIDNDDAVCTVYGAAVTDNTNSDIRITKGTLNLSDDEEQTKKTIGKLVVDGGILNISGNTEIFDLVINGGTVNITGNITSAEGITINPVSYTDGTVIAALSDEVNKDTILSKLNIEEKYQDVCTLNIEESSVVVNIEGDITVYDTNVDVDYAVNEGESNRVASGSLHAIDYKTPAEYLSDGIYIKAVRGQAHQHDYDENYEYVPGILDDKTYTRLLDANPDNALMVGLYYGFKTMKGKAWQDAALENDGQTWKNYIKNDFMPEAFDENGNKIKKVYLWIPWNEPDLQWNKNMAGFYQAYEYAYDAVKEFDARELVQGPEFTRYKYENLTAFLTYCRDNDCLPDVLSWHELEAYPLSAENHCNQIRNWMLDNGIEPMPIAITEYQGTGYDLTDEGRKNQGTYNPGLAVTYIAPMERAEKYGFIYGLQSAWGRGGGDPLFVADLGQMADIETGTMPTGMWYVYHAYKNLTGKKVGISLNRDYGMDAVAAYDSSSDKKSSTIIIGKWTEESKNLSINLKNIPENLIVNNKISVKAESIPETLAVPLYASPVLTDKEYKVTGGNAVVEVPIEGRSAIALTITPPSDREQKQVIGLNGAETTGDITVSTVDGILYAENGKTSSYKNDNPTGNEKTTSYKDSGDSIAFKTNVAEDGLYKFEGVHITGSDGGFMQCYADGEAFAVPQDLYAESEGQKQVNYGNLYLTKGEHEFLFRIVGFGKNEAGQGTKLSFKELSLTPVKTAENEAVVKFDMNCEDASMVQTSSSVIAGDKLGFIPAAERKNYQLLNWNTKEDGSGDIVTADTVINEDKTIYAQWKLSYSAKFLKNPNKIAELSVENNIASIKITLPANKTVTLYANNVDISEELTVSDGIASAQVPLTENVVFDYDITGPETISFDMSQSEEMTHGSAGFLYGISEIDVPSIDLLRGVKPVVTVQKAARGKQHPTADAVRVRSMLDSAGAYNIQVYLQDIYLEWPYDAPRNEDGTVDLDSYQKTVESILYDMICDPADKDTAGAFLGSDGNYYVLNETEAKRYSYVLFNEPDQIWFGKNVAGAHDIAAAWNKIYKAVKAIDPNAKCAGPNWAMFGADRMVAFLGDCKENNCLPEMITWHELDDNSRFWTWYERLHDRYIPEYYKDAGYTPEILVNEYVGYNYIGLTGKIMQQVQQFEDADIMGCMAYWGLANSMNEMAADRNSPTATWWLYHWYAQMTGSQKPCSSSEGLYGVTSYDEEANMAYTLFGGNTEQGGINRVSLENISNTDLVGEKGACHVKIYGTGYSGTMGADYSPELIYEGNITAKNDALRFEVKSTDEADIYFAVVTKTDEPGAEPEPAELSALSYEAENADILGNAVIQSRLSSSDFGVSGKKTVGNIVKNGDGVEFTVEVPNDGIYDASIFYAVQAPYVNPKTLVPDNNGQNRAIGKVLPFGMSVDGGAVLTLNFESTARWIYETQCHKDIYLTAGTHKIRYEHINGDESAKGNLQLTAVLDKLSLTPVKNESQRYNFTVEMKEMKGFRTGDTCEITAMAPVSGYYTLSGNADFTAEKLCVDYAPDAKSESVCSTNRYAIGKTVYLSQGANTLYIKDNGALDELKFTYEQEKTTNGTSVISADKLS